MDNSIISYNGIEIYKSDVNRMIDEFINDYSIDTEMLYKSNTFISLLSYIHDNLLKNIITKDNGVNKNGYDYKLLDEIFRKIFIPVCGKYNHIVSVWNFAVLTGMNSDYISEVISGYYKNGGRVNPENTRTAKKWYEASKAATMTQAQEQNSVGSIFIAKSVYGLQETPQEIRITGNTTQATPEQIAEKYRDIKQPALPDLES